MRPGPLVVLLVCCLAVAGDAAAQEPGVLRFDVLQQPDDPTRFLLVECYRAPADQAAHRETAHYLRWRDAVADMMAEPRAAVKYAPVYWSAGETR